MKLSVLSADSTVATFRAQARPAELVRAMISHTAIVIAQLTTMLLMNEWTPVVSWAAVQDGLARCSSARTLPLVASVAIRSSAASAAPAYISHTAICTDRGSGTGCAAAAGAGAAPRGPRAGARGAPAAVPRVRAGAVPGAPALGRLALGPLALGPLALGRLPAGCLGLAMAAPGRVGGAAGARAAVGESRASGTTFRMDT